MAIKVSIMREIKIVLIAGIFIMVLGGCKKSTAPPAAKTNTDLLTQKTWKCIKVEKGGVDYTGLVPSCIIDNITTFVSSGTGIVDEGATKCSDTDPQQQPFTWVFQSNETVLVVTQGSTTQPASILQLDDNTLKIQTVYMGYNVVETSAHP
jgi:hypothetical protein